MMPANKIFIDADLDLDFITAGTTTRGLDLVEAVSNPPYHRFNLGLHMQDSPDLVESNRRLLEQQLQLPSAPCWLNQVHGTEIIQQPQQLSAAAIADASYSTQKQIVLAVLTADCLPVILASERADWIAVVHCGWRSLAAGILSKTLAKAPQKPQKIRAWFGPAIGPEAFEVGEEVKLSFQNSLKKIIKNCNLNSAFVKKSEKKYLANLSELARIELKHHGLKWIKGGDLCSYSDAQKFFSYRRDGETGRMATLAWIK
jgi:hypothetical protein